MAIRLGRVRKGIARLRDRIGKFAYAGGRKRKVKANRKATGLARYDPAFGNSGSSGAKSKAKVNRKFTAAKLGKAARYAWQNPAQARYFLKNHYLAKAAYKRFTAPFRNVRDTIGLNIPKPIRSRVRAVKAKINRPINRFKARHGATFARAWASDSVKAFAIYGVALSAVTANSVYHQRTNRRLEKR